MDHLLRGLLHLPVGVLGLVGGGSEVLLLWLYGGLILCLGLLLVA